MLKPTLLAILDQLEPPFVDFSTWKYLTPAPVNEELPFASKVNVPPGPESAIDAPVSIVLRVSSALLSAT